MSILSLTARNCTLSYLDMLLVCLNIEQEIRKKRKGFHICQCWRRNKILQYEANPFVNIEQEIENEVPNKSSCNRRPDIVAALFPSLTSQAAAALFCFTTVIIITMEYLFLIFSNWPCLSMSDDLTNLVTSHDRIYLNLISLLHSISFPEI